MPPDIKRRTFLQACAVALGVPFVTLAQETPEGIVYTDSESSADLSPLYDGDTTSGGVEYAP